MNILTSAVVIFIALLAVGKIAFSIPLDTTVVASTSLKFSTASLDSYADRMTNLQPADNDRLLPGDGKNHALEAMASVAEDENTVVVSVLEQIGDIFS